MPGVLERYQRRTARLTVAVRSVVRELAGCAGIRLLAALPVPLSRHTAIRMLLQIPLPPRSTPKALSVDDFALRCGQHYASVLIDAATHQRIDVLPDRKSDSLRAWLCEHLEVEVLMRDGSTAYAEGARRALPGMVHASGRWHLWNGLGRMVEKAVVAHSACWAKAWPQTTAVDPRDNNFATLARPARPARPRRRTAGLLASARSGTQHRQTLCPSPATRSAPPPAAISHPPGRPLAGSPQNPPR
ncbi:transposase [Nocardia sp. NPDC004123]